MTEPVASDEARLRQVVDAGVEVYAYRCKVSTEETVLDAQILVKL